MTEAGLLDKMAMVFGQMGDNSASCSMPSVVFTLAEYLRDEKKQDVLLFVRQYIPLCTGLFGDQRSDEPYAHRERSGNHRDERR